MAPWCTYKTRRCRCGGHLSADVDFCWRLRNQRQNHELLHLHQSSHDLVQLGHISGRRHAAGGRHLGQCGQRLLPEDLRYDSRECRHSVRQRRLLPDRHRSAAADPRLPGLLRRAEGEQVPADHVLLCRPHHLHCGDRRRGGRSPFTSSVAESFLGSVLTPVLEKDYGPDTEVTKIWNNTMTELSCCGVNGYGDFNNSKFVESYKHYPTQCCNSTSCGLQDAERAKIKGCFQQILDLLKSKRRRRGGVAAGICALELAALVVSMYLYCKIDKEGSIH
ncbi:tetraspanin-1 [Bufo bufo]|uniref:tetraspanin-1 n=1 Tax=Bufo bufo TaxID=8384 RepID=UPI001ABE8C1D|nr:tetraspanin-1 [Bufo bufo]